MNNVHENTNNTTSANAFKILMILIWTQDTLWGFIRVFFMGIPIINSIADYIIPGMLIVFAILSLPWIIMNIRTTDMLIYVILILCIFVSTQLYPRNAPYIESSFIDIVIKALPMYFIGLAYNHEISKQQLYFCSLVSILGMSIYQFYLLSTGRELNSDNMHAAYSVLPSVMYIIYYFFENKKSMALFLCIIGIFLVFSYGTRGPVLAMIVFLIVGIYLKSRKNRYLYICIGIGVVFLIFSTDIVMRSVMYLQNTFEEIGLSTRIFDFFINGDITYSSGRDIIMDDTVALIKRKALFGYGMMGDRYYLSGSYTHNLFLELWCHYGIILGSALILFFISTPLEGLRCCKADIKLFLIMLVCMIYTKLMVSSSYLIEPFLYFMIGVSVAAVRKAKLRRLC
ncbi:MAG: O-antigen ligase family protein [Clostridia bacterium]|nr:O-antigen ligase family protein [Clostridia bacterium]